MADRRTLKEMEKKCREIGQSIGDRLQSSGYRGIGFALLLFDFGPGGFSTYISNAQRADMIKALREQADVLEKGLDKPPGVLEP